MGDRANLAISLALCLLVFIVMVSRCRPGCPGTHYIGRSGLKLTEIHLLLLPKCWESSCGPLLQALASITTPSTVFYAQSERFCAMTFWYSMLFKITLCVEFVRHCSVFQVLIHIPVLKPWHYSHLTEKEIEVRAEEWHSKNLNRC